MIKSFKDKRSATIFAGRSVSMLPSEIQRRALNKLRILDKSQQLAELRIPPGNRLEALSGNRQGQHSIRINDQWRICFRWQDTDAYEVEITDYH